MESDNTIISLSQAILEPKENYPIILPEDFKAHWIPGLTNEQYHSDKTAVSSTGLKKILKSPLSFYASHVQGIRGEETPSMNFGSAFHMALLEPLEFEKSYVLMPEFKGTGSVSARYEWKVSQKPGAVILKEKEYQDLQGMLNSVLRHNGACKILKNGQSEVSGYFRDPITGIKCRFRPDFMHLGEMALLDVKTTTNVEASEFSKTMWNYRYDMQIYQYCLGMEQITGRRVKWPLFLAIERLPPYEIAVYSVDEMVLEKGRIDYEIAMLKLKECLENGSWIGYQSKIETISLPAWVMRNME